MREVRSEMRRDIEISERDDISDEIDETEVHLGVLARASFDQSLYTQP